MEIKDLVGGEIYYLELNLPQNNNPIWIQKWKGEGLEKKGRFDSGWEPFVPDTKFLKIRIATPEEKHWLNECIKADKFIPYEECYKKPKLKIRDFTPYKPKLEKKVKLIIRKTKTIKIKQNG